MENLKSKFQDPQLQSFRGVFVIFIADLIKRVRQNLALIAIPIFSSRVREYMVYVLLIVGLLILIQFLFSYWTYKRYKFRVGHSAFFLDQGIFNRRNIEIPFERIQNINLQQNLIQQALNVVGLDIETAGNEKPEVTIKALDKDDAEALRALLTAQKQDTVLDENISDSTTTAKLNTQKQSTKDHHRNAHLLFQLRFVDLIKVGISSNFFKGIGFILAILSFLYSSFGDFISDETYEDIETKLTSVLPSLMTVMIGVTFAVIIIGFMTTVLLTIVQYFDLKLYRVNTNYSVQYGLLQRVNKLIKAQKTQIVEIDTNPLRNLFKFSNVFISQASSNELSNKQKIGIVGVSKDHIEILFKALFNITKLEAIRFDYYRTQTLRFRVISLRLTGLFSGIILLQHLVIDNYNYLIIPALIVVLIALLGLIYLGTTKSYIGISDQLVKVGSGTVNTSTAYIEIFKIQSVAVRQTYYQQRVNHCSLMIYTASGPLKIKYLKLEEAKALANFILFKIESNATHWM